MDCRIKWPNDLLLNGKKIVGILCESVSYGCRMQAGASSAASASIGTAQSYFDAANLPNGTSLELQGAKVDLAADPQWLAEALTDFGFDRPLYAFAREASLPFRDEYKAACVNLGRHVTFDLPGGGTGSGTAIDVDADGRLIVRTDSGERGSLPAKSPSTASGPYIFSEFQRLCGPSGPGGALLFSLRSLWKTRVFHGFPHGFAGQRLWKTPAPKIPEGRGAFAPSAKCRRK